MRRLKNKDAFTALQMRLTLALGEHFKVQNFGHPWCDLDVWFPDPVSGGLTVCLEKRRWCPGGTLHARPFLATSEWMGLQMEGYAGRGWVEKMAADIKRAGLTYFEKDVEQHPGILKGQSPEEIRKKFL